MAGTNRSSLIYSKRYENGSQLDQEPFILLARDRGVHACVCSFTTGGEPDFVSVEKMGTYMFFSS